MSRHEKERDTIFVTNCAIRAWDINKNSSFFLSLRARMERLVTKMVSIYQVNEK